jgi:hypothetical protein
MTTHKPITPECCDDAKISGAVFLRFDEAILYGNSKGQAGFKPSWVTRGYAFDGVPYAARAKYCPFCAAPVPPIVPRQTAEKICSVTDGGYYCDTCKERLIGCTCMAPEYAWRPAANHADLHRAAQGLLDALDKL